MRGNDIMAYQETESDLLGLEIIVGVHMRSEDRECSSL
jgi:hypothetical protein